MEMMKSKPIVETIPVLLGSNANEGFWSLMYYIPDVMPNRELNATEKNLTTEQYNANVAKIYNFYPTEVLNCAEEYNKKTKVLCILLPMYVRLITVESYIYIDRIRRPLPDCTKRKLRVTLPNLTH